MNVESAVSKHFIYSIPAVFEERLEIILITITMISLQLIVVIEIN